MKMNTPPVGQASRLSFHSWKRRLQHFQLYNDSRDGCPTVGYYFRDGCPTNRGEGNQTKILNIKDS
jgi:hypothetical protein